MMTTHKALAAAAMAALVLSVGAASATADDDHHDRFVSARLRGVNEVPAVSSTGKGSFSAKIDDSAGSLEFKLSYSDLEGTTVTQAHVHIGQTRVNGGVSFFLCGGGTKPDPCPPAPATVTGTVAAADIAGPAGQGIAAGEFKEVVALLRAGIAYANVHTDKHPGGEIRGQIN